jgi:hypothetical protein
MSSEWHESRLFRITQEKPVTWTDQQSVAEAVISPNAIAGAVRLMEAAGDR